MQVPQSSSEVFYPESDGKPMADNTKQAAWIIALYNNLRWVLREQVAFVAADLFWYPVEGEPRIVTAPDVLVALGRPDGHRGSYQQWKEGGVAPQVVFEVLSPSNTPMEMLSKVSFYDRHGVEECIIIDPDEESFKAYLRKEGKLAEPDFPLMRWQSPRLGISLAIESGALQAYLPDGSPFKTLEEEVKKAEEARARAEAAESEIERLRAKLKELEGE